MPPGGAVVGEKREASEGVDSKCRNACPALGVGGTIWLMVREKLWSKPGVRIVRFAGFRRADLLGRLIGDGGAERLWDVDSRTEAVEMAGRDDG